MVRRVCVSIGLAAFLTLAPDAGAAPRKVVPFVGVRAFNFLGGTGTGRVVAIDEGGRVRIWDVGVCSIGLVYDGPWRRELPVGDGFVVRLGRGDAALFRHGKPVRGCADAAPAKACRAPLERASGVPRVGQTGMC